MCQSDSNLSTTKIRRLLIGIFFLLVISVPNIYADDGFDDQINDLFDWLNDVISESVNDTGLPQNTETNLQNAVNSGTEVGKQGAGLWFQAHSFFVDLIFTGTSETDLPISKDLIVIISMFLVAFLGIILLKKLLHENFKIVIIIIFVILALAFTGLNIDF